MIKVTLAVRRSTKGSEGATKGSDKSRGSEKVEERQCKGQPRQ